MNLEIEVAKCSQVDKVFTVQQEVIPSYSGRLPTRYAYSSDAAVDSVLYALWVAATVWFTVHAVTFPYVWLLENLKKKTHAIYSSSNKTMETL